MQKIWLYVWRGYIRMGMYFYFRRVNVFGLENLPNAYNIWVSTKRKQ